MAPQTDRLVDQINIAIQNQKRPTVTVLSSLLAIQDEIGYIPDEAIEQVAVKMDTSKNAVYGVASFYPNFRFTPPGDHSVEVCWGPTCHLAGAANILEKVLNELNLETEGDTSDGRVSFRFNTCLGACSQAPVVNVNHELFGKVNPEYVVDLIKNMSSDDSSH